MFMIEYTLLSHTPQNMNGPLSILPLISCQRPVMILPPSKQRLHDHRSNGSSTSNLTVTTPY